MSITFKELCEISGYSKTTVSRVLNNNPNVNAKTVAKIQKVIDTHHYRPSATARNLSLQRTNLIGFVMPSIRTGYFAEVLHGVEHVLSQHNIRMLLMIHRPERDLFKEDSPLFVEKGTMDGLLIMVPDLSKEQLHFIEEQEMPVVMVNNHNSRMLSSLCDNSEQGAYMVTSHLLKNGHRSILPILGPKTSNHSEERWEGYLRAMREYKVPVDEKYFVRGTFRQDGSVEPFLRFMKKTKKLPDAVFSFNDQMAIAIKSAWEGQGGSIPDDFSLFGYDGIEETAYHSISTFDTSPSQIGGESAAMICKKSYGDTNEVSHRFVTGKLIIRNSSK